MTLDDVRSFLDRYQKGSAYSDTASTPTLGEPPSDWVREHQRETVGSPDEHVIPIDDFEFRIQEPDDDLEDDSDFIRTENAIWAVEKAWDRLIGDYGLNAVSTYVPFHEDQNAYGIYIQQRGIRFLGHLLYQWSRVGSISDTRKQATKFLSDNNFQDSDRLFQGEPQFNSIENAFALAQEILLRHQWFHHQFELLAALIEDVADTLYYPQYHQQYLSTDIIGKSHEEVLANAYVARSQACANKTPSELYQPLFRRAMAARRSNQRYFRQYTDSFTSGCYEVSSQLVTPKSSQPTSRGVALSRELVFDTDVLGAIPSRISAFVTRKESDPTNASYARDEHPLSQVYTISQSDEWKKTYENADKNIRDLVDVIEKKAKNNPHTLDQKGRGEGPKNRFYGYLNGGARRFIYEINHRNNHVDLLDFGGHDLPEQYGLYKS